MPAEVLKSTESHDLAPAEYFSTAWNDSLFVHTALPERLCLCHRGGGEGRERLSVVVAKLELNFSPLLHEASHRYFLLLVLLFKSQVTSEKPLVPLRPQSSQSGLLDPQGLRIWQWQLIRLNNSCHLLRALDTLIRYFMTTSNS